MASLNYHHLRYFHAVAHEGHLTQAAQRLNVSQSALSAQIKALEERLGVALFHREGRTLRLTEPGRIALDHADRIFATGQELIATLARDSDRMPRLRVGAEATLSRNFQLQFLRPALRRADLEVSLHSTSRAELLAGLEALALDVVLTTEPPRDMPGVIAHEIAAQDVALHASPARLRHPSLKAILDREPLIVPSEAAIRAGFDSLCARLGVSPRIVAAVDDMAMVRLLARSDFGVALAPPVVLADETASGLLARAPYDLGISERFYALTTPRSYPHPLLGALLPEGPETGRADARS